MSQSLTTLIRYTYICREFNGPLNYALIKQSLIWTDKELGNLAAIWKTGLSVTERWERGMAELWVNPRQGKNEGGRTRQQEKKQRQKKTKQIKDNENSRLKKTVREVGYKG